MKRAAAGAIFDTTNLETIDFVKKIKKNKENLRKFKKFTTLSAQSPELLFLYGDYTDIYRTENLTKSKRRQRVSRAILFFIFKLKVSLLCILWVIFF